MEVSHDPEEKQQVIGTSIEPEPFIGHSSHQSAKYRIRQGEKSKRHSSSGVIVATGAGATDWTASITPAPDQAQTVQAL